MNHDEALALLDAYVDGELSTAEALSYEVHVAACAGCASRVTARRDRVRRLGAAPLLYAVPPAVRQRALRNAAPPAPQRPRFRPAAWFGAVLAASLLVFTGGFYAGTWRSEADDVGAAFASAHVRALLDEHVVDVASSDHHSVKPWFAGKIAFSPPVPELPGSGYELLGGRLDYVGHTRCAALVYRAGKHVLTVFLWPRTTVAEAPLRATTSDGYRVLGADAGDLRVAIVTDMGAAEAAKFRSAWLAGAAR